MSDNKQRPPHVTHEAAIEQAIGMLIGYPEWYEITQTARDRIWGALRWLVDTTHGVERPAPFGHISENYVASVSRVGGAYERYAACVRSLHVLAVEGKAEDAEADLLREGMDGLWEALTPTQRALASGLTADLNWLQKSRKGSVVAALPSAEWVRLLEALRHMDPPLPNEALAQLRAIAWTALGDSASADLFKKG